MFSGFESGVVLQDPVGEDSSFENKNKLVMPVESSPASAGGLSELEHHRETGLPRAAALRAAMPQADRREGALDRVGRPQVTPVLGGKVVEGEEGIPVLREAGARRLVLRPVLLQEVIEGFDRRIPCLGEPDLVKVALRLRGLPRLSALSAYSTRKALCANDR